MKKLTLVMSMVLVLVTAMKVQATLIDRGADTLGNHYIYDTDLNVTWYDSPAILTDFFFADSWAHDLSLSNDNASNVTGWRLPKDPGVYNYSNAGNEVAHLYYIEFGNPEFGPPVNTGFLSRVTYWTSNAGLFAFYSGQQSWNSPLASGVYFAIVVHDGDVASPVPTPTPEPATVLLLGLGLAGLAVVRRQLEDRR